MAVEIITKDDLKEFQLELINEVKKLFKENSGNPSKRWLKSYEVKKLIGVSPGKLQQMRINGSLPFTKIGSVMYYDYEDIQKMLSTKKISGSK